MNKKRIKSIVKDAYGKISRSQKGCGCSTCEPDTKEFAKFIGYSEEELRNIPDDANLALGCGNPTALAELKEGEIVLDLGSGAGMDCFLAASKLGPNGKVIGVDMTPEMIEKAKVNAKKRGVKNVEFLLGEIEKLPVENNSIDVVISNCVINLSVDKSKVFQEIFRVLRPGGRIAISDIALLKKLPKKIQKNVESYVGCLSGALLMEEYVEIVKSSGFKNVKATIKGSSACIDPDTKDPIARIILDNLGKNKSLADYVVSVYVEGCKE